MTLAEQMAGILEFPLGTILAVLVAALTVFIVALALHVRDLASDLDWTRRGLEEERARRLANDNEAGGLRADLERPIDDARRLN